MNCKEHYLPELELPTVHVRESLQAILCTILFIRSPGPVSPRDVECEGFDLTYPRIASSSNSSVVAPSLDYDVDKKVDESIQSFLMTLSQIGPELLSGSLTLSFFERRKTQQLFGLVSNEERVVWEQWHLRVVVNNTPRPVSDDSAAVIERQRIQDTAEGMLRSVLTKIYEIAGSSIDHVPPVMYEFEISCSKKVDDRENVYSRVTNMPNLININF
ncbi:autophagy-related protein [Nitzschia inconspicua]|uniref:Autophagy-related protein 101 n=1 Tax=Nitzschia inconspicua TaxID=303405 RepID=A0A9K3M5P8_9STRA|nr:autophagy-related protein [Nitzschia inconspicua]KAG7374364.1 autophagy-related protein [Nitzschia inconspicua]